MKETIQVSPNIPSDHAREDLEMLLLIRRFEEKLLELFSEGKLNGTTHTCIGQEYVPTALMPLLRKDDFLFSNHRGHGHYLAHFRDPEGLLAEIMGRAGAICNGVGGSQHLRRGRYLSTGVQGESLAVGVGTAFACKREGLGSITICFIGDGTWGEGAVYEALNLASLHQAPLVVVVENNEIAQTTPRSLNMAGTIANRAAAFEIPHLLFRFKDPSEIRESLRPTIDKVRSGSGPVILEFIVNRLGPHSKGDDTRDEGEVSELRQADWLQHYTKNQPELLAELNHKVLDELEALVASVEARPLILAAPTLMELVVTHLNQALHALMKSDEKAILLGEDILDPYGGAFKVCDGLSSAFGDRVLPMPISEGSILGMANGLSLAGYHPVVELMFGDFIFLAADQLINFAAKSVSMYGRRFPHPLIVRCPVGGHRGYGPTHSQSVQKHLIGVPNLDLYEITAFHNLASLLPEIFEGGRPSVIFENKALYTRPRHTGCGPEELFDFDFPSGEGSFVRIFLQQGGTPDALIITTGGSMESALHAATDLLIDHELECQIVVPWRIYPLDPAPLRSLAQQARFVFVVEESTGGGTWGAEVACALNLLDAPNPKPIRLVHSRSEIIPTARHLENEILVSADDIVQTVLRSIR